MTPDEQMLDPEAMGQTPIAEERLEALGLALAARRDAWATARQASGVEKRWADDLDQYMGVDEATKAVSSMMDSAEAGYPLVNKDAKPQRSTVYVNLTRPKTNTAEARVANMLLPTDDRNWGAKPSPMPELTALAKQQAQERAKLMVPADQQPPQQPMPAQPQAMPAAQMQPSTMQGQPPQQMAPQAPPQQPTAAPQAPQPLLGNIQWPTVDAQAQIDVAMVCSKAMQDEIDDQLQECGFNGECRAMIHDAAVLGTGVIKGPVVVNRRKRSWTPMTSGTRTVHVLEIEIEQRPESRCVSPWNVLTDPSCGNDHRNGGGVFERSGRTAKQLRDLAKQPGYIRANIAAVLAMGPQPATNTTSQDRKRAQEHGSMPYDCWEFWGDFEPEDLRSAGVFVPDGATELLSGCVEFVNGIVIRGFLNPDETGEIPYDLFVWEPDSNSVWGYGVPFMCRPAQKVLNAAWRQLMDNSALSVGPIIVVNRAAVQPVNGLWEITGRKLFELVDTSVTDIKQVFMVAEFNNHGKEIQQIVDLALRFFDLETSVPQLEQGEHANAPETLGGMVIQQNSTNIVLGRLTKHFDDTVTSPHIGRYVDWNMAYNSKAEIKGDHNIVARGTSALLVKDLQNQALLQLGQYQASGIVSPMVRWEEWFKDVLRSQHIDPATIMKDEATIAALSNQPPQATPDQIRAQAILQAATLRADATVKAANAKVQGELAYVQTERAMFVDNHHAKDLERQDMLQLEMLKYANQQKLSLEQIRADLAKTSMQEDTKRQLAALSAQVNANEGHATRAHDLHTTALTAPQTPQ